MYFLLVTRKLLSGSVRVVFVVRVLLIRSIQCANMAAGWILQAKKWNLSGIINGSSYNTCGHLSCSLLLFYSPPQGSENAAQLAKHTCVLHVKPLNKVFVTNFKQMNYPRVSFPNPSHTRILRRVSSVHLCNSKHHQKKNTNQFFVHFDRLYSALTGFSHRLLGSAKSVLWRAERWCTIACNSNL